MAPSVEERVEEAAAEYLRAVDRGSPPERDEFLARHSDLAAELGEFLDDLIRFRVLATPRNCGEETSQEANGAATATFNGSVKVTACDSPVHIPNYEIQSEIGRGGMGVVYRARQVSINRLVALKTISPDRVETRADHDRFLQEAEAAATLDHPSIVPIYEVGAADGRSYFTMKLVAGGSLADCKDGYFKNSRAAAALVAQVARAVHYAHQRGILHRDLKPSNILLGPAGEPMVADFGLAKRLDGSVDVSKSGVIVGTPAYMAPEQARGEKGLTTSADVYGLGAVLYELLTGRAPFRAPSPAETIVLVLTKEAVRPRSLNPLVSADLEAICLKCLTKEPAARYGSAEALADDLQHWLEGEPISARPARSVERIGKWAKRNPTATALIGVAAVAIGAIVWATVALLYNARLAEAKGRADEAFTDMRATKEKLDDALARETAEKQEAGRLRVLAEERGDQIGRLLYAVRFQAGAGLLRDGLVERAADRFPAPRGTSPPEWSGVEWALLGIRLAHSAEVGREWHTVFSPGYSQLASTRVVSDHVGAVAFDSKGSQVAVAELAKGICLYDTDSGAERVRFDRAPQPSPLATWWPTWPIDEAVRLTRMGRWRPGVPCTGLAITPTRLLAAHPACGCLSVWDLASGQFQFACCLPAGEGLARWAVSSDGRRLAAAGTGGTVTVWSVESGKPIAQLSGLSTGPVAIVLSPNGETLATGGANPGVWNVSDGRLIRKLSLQAKAPPWQDLAFLPSGTRIIGADGNGLHLWEPASDNPPTQLLRADVSRVSVSTDGQVVAGVGPKGIHLIGPAGQQLARWIVDQPPVLAVHVTGTRVAVATAGLDRLVRVGVAALNAARHHEISGRVEVRSLTFNKDGSMAAGLTMDGIRVWSIPDGRVLHEFDKMQDGQQRPAFSGDGCFLGVNSSTGAKVYDLRTGRLFADLKTREGKAIPYISGDVAFSPNGDLLAAANTYHINVWRISTGEQLLSLPAEQPGKKGYWAITVAFSPDGLLLATGSGTWYTGSANVVGGVVKIWNVRTGELIRSLPPQLDGIYGLAWSPDGQRLATGSGIYQRSDRAAVKVWDAATGDLVYDLKGHAECVWSVAFSPDGRRLASASGRCTVYGGRKGLPDNGETRIWDMTTGLELLTRRESDRTAYTVAFSSDGRWFGTGRADGVIRLWEIEPTPEPVNMEPPSP